MVLFHLKQFSEFLYESHFKIDFLKTLTTHQKSTHGKWLTHLPFERIRFNFED